MTQNSSTNSDQTRELLVVACATCNRRDSFARLLGSSNKPNMRQFAASYHDWFSGDRRKFRATRDGRFVVPKRMGSARYIYNALWRFLLFPFLRKPVPGSPYQGRPTEARLTTFNEWQDQPPEPGMERQR